MRAAGRRTCGQPKANLACRVALPLMLAAVLSVNVAPAAAHEAISTLEEYSANVAEVHDTSVRVLADDSVTAAEASELSELTLGMLPDGQMVSMGEGNVVAVDNAVAASLAERLRAASDERARTEIAEDLRGHLAAQVVAVGEPGTVVPSDPDALDVLLSEQQVQARNPASEWFADFVNRLGEMLMGWWEGAGVTPAVAGTLRVVTIVLLTLMALGLAWMLLRIVIHLRAGTAKRTAAPRPADDAAIIAAAEGLPDDVLAHADALAAGGQWRDGVRALFGGAARELVTAGYVIEAHRRTNGELLLEIRPAAPHVYEPLARLCGVFEMAWYGHHEPGSEGYASARDEYAQVLARLAEEPAPASADRAGGDAS